MPVYASESSRLHALLSAVMQQDQHRTLRATWSQVLGMPETDIQFGPFGLPRVAALISGAECDAVRADEQVGLPVRNELVVEWSKPVMTPGGNLDGPLHQQAVSPESLAYLLSVASVLHKREGHTALPEADELAGLLGQISELAQSVEAADELPDDVRRAVLRRIAQVRFAIDNVRIGGGEDVQEAVELLLGATVVRAGGMSTATAKKVWRVALAVFAVFVSGPQIQASLEAWPNVIALASGTEHEPAPPKSDEQHRLDQAQSGQGER